MKMVSPSEWGASVNYDAWNDRQFLKDAVAIHWGGTHAPTWDDGPEAEAAILRAWEKYHIEKKGWRGIAYGYAVGASGTVYRLRGRHRYGAHLGDVDNDGVQNNDEVVPIVMIQGENSGPLNAEAWLSLRALYQWLLRQDWTIGDLPVYGHREIQPSKPTQCPGDDIQSGIDKGWVQIPPPGQEPSDPLEDRVVALEEFMQKVKDL